MTEPAEHDPLMLPADEGQAIADAVAAATAALRAEASRTRLACWWARRQLERAFGGRR